MEDAMWHGHRHHPNNRQMMHVIFACLFAADPLLSLTWCAAMVEVICIEKFTRVEFTMEIIYN